MKSTCSSCPVADVICRTIELGLTIEGAFIGEGDITIIQARPIEALPFCPKCGAEGVLRDHITRELTDLPVAGQISQFPGDVIAKDPFGTALGAERDRLDRSGLDDGDVALADERALDRQPQFDGPANYVCHGAGRTGRFHGEPWV